MNQRVSQLADVPELVSSDPASFAWRVLHERHPAIIARVRDDFAYDSHQLDALEALEAEITDGVLTPLPRDADDHAEWDSWGEPHFGRPWDAVPFLWAESYFYRRLLESVDFFRPGELFHHDLFRLRKQAELDDPTLTGYLGNFAAAYELPDRLRAGLVAAVWGNRADLSFLIENDLATADGGLIVDDSAVVGELLSSSTDANVLMFADNAGRELLADLFLIDELLTAGSVAVVELQVKPYPYFVSDAVVADVVAALRRLAVTRGHAGRVADRLGVAMRDERLLVTTHPFHVAPVPFQEMPADLRERVEAATLTILKGDLNYRRLVGDRAWPATEPFAEVAGHFPAPVVSLRTLKSTVVTGVPATTVAELDATGADWRTTGAHGMIQIAR